MAVRSETTKNKAGALLSAIYSSTPSCTRVTFQEDAQDIPGTGNEERVDQDTNIPRAIDEVPRITFVDECILGVIAFGDVTDLPEQEDEFDTDSESDADNATDITFSTIGRAIHAHFRLDL